MSRARLALCWGVLLLGVSARPSAAQPAEPSSPQRPNVVFVLADDLGWSDLGCYGNRFHETPHIDRLAKAGLRLTHAYAAGAVCSPTRASLMTGKYPHRVGISDFISGHFRPWAKLLVPEINQHLELSEVTLAERFRTAGYATCFLGKWHLGGKDYYPQHQGFDEALVQQGRHFGTHLSGTRELQLEPDEYLADRLTDECIDFIRNHREEPFFVYLSHYAVHIPLQADAKKIAKYEAKAQATNHRQSHPTYAAMVEHLDDSVGRITEALEQFGLSEDTVFVFFSDNGGLRRSVVIDGPDVTTNAPLRDEKGTLYEGGIRVPLIVRWPGRVRQGTVTDQPLISHDLVPTLLDLCGISLAAPVDIDGTSWAHEWQEEPSDERSSDERPPLFWHYPHYHHMDPAGAVLEFPWKLIEHFEDGSIELFHLNDDPGERHNLATVHPAIAEKLRADLLQWRQETSAPLPVPNPDYDPQRALTIKKRPR